MQCPACNISQRLSLRFHIPPVGRPFPILNKPSPPPSLLSNVQRRFSGHAEHRAFQRELAPRSVPEGSRSAGAGTRESGHEEVQQPGDVVSAFGERARRHPCSCPATDALCDGTSLHRHRKHMGGSVSSMLTIVYYGAGSPRLPTRDPLASCKHTRLARSQQANLSVCGTSIGHVAFLAIFG